MRLRGGLWIALPPAVCMAYQALVHALIVDAQSPVTRTALAALNGLPHAAINLFLLWVFGRTLLHGREPLVTVFARRVHGNVPAHVAAYTRRVTAAWCVFFAAQIAVSAMLFAAGRLEVWSFFVNVLALPLVAVMFASEYLYRIARFPQDDHVSIWKGVEAYLRHTRHARNAEAPAQNP